MKTALLIIPFLVLSYAVVDVFASSAGVDMYADIKSMTPKDRCLSAFENTTNISQCKYL